MAGDLGQQLVPEETAAGEFRGSWRRKAKVPIHFRVGLQVSSLTGRIGSPSARGYSWSPFTEGHGELRYVVFFV